MLELPLGFQKQMQEMLGLEYSEFTKSIEQKPKTTFRINPNKLSELDNIQAINTEQNIEWCEYGYTLESRPEFVLDPFYHAGCYYPQESSSMFMAQYLLDLDKDKPLKVLDLCASPGGKSTLLLSYLPKDSLLVSNEIDPLRARILKDNIIRFGSTNCVVTSNKVEDFVHFQDFFDLILIDAPCSGEGMMSKEDEAIRQWSPELIQSCARTQKQITSEIWNCLKAGGRMIYSTCTYNQLENEEIVSELLVNKNASVIDSKYSSNNQIKQFLPNQYHFFPHLMNGLGFFAACIVKGENSLEQEQSQQRHKGRDPLYFKPFLPNLEFRLDSELFDTVSRDSILFNIPKLWRSEIIELMKRLKVIKFGVEIGQWKGPDWFPSHELSLCYEYKNNVNRIELSHEQAIKFLKKEAVEFELSFENGWALAIFQKQSLGWFKVIQRKPKNYLPTDWRIRQS
jgi:16S rRNA C967 or C1407 C5-methylase (RsmB/RsmF family)/NOL1/NOP2/fmu family ribosome biogenesis protein